MGALRAKLKEELPKYRGRMGPGVICDHGGRLCTSCWTGESRYDNE